MPPEALLKLREKYPQYADIPDRQLAQQVIEKYPQYKDLLGDIARVKPGSEEQATEAAAGFVRTPTGLEGAILSAPLIGAGGVVASAAKIPAVVGRIAAAGGLGAGRRLQEGHTGMEPVWGGLLDAIVAGLTEGAISTVTSGGKIPLTNIKIGLPEWGAPARAFEWATKAPRKAIDMVASRLPKAPVLNVPSISNKPMTVDDAVAKLAQMTDAEYQVTRAEIASELSRLDIQKSIPTPSGQFVKGPGPSAGQVFKKFTEPERVAPSSFAKLAESVRGGLTGPTGRSIEDALALTSVAGAPIGGWALGALLPSLARHLPGGKQLVGEEEHRGGGY